MDLTSVDIYYLCKELQEFLPAKVEKILQSDTDKKDILFMLYSKGRKINLRTKLPGLLCTPEVKPSVYPVKPPGFVMFLRKYLKSARMSSIEQQGFSRVVMIGFEHGSEKYELYIEFVPPGNMALVQEGMIKNVLEMHQYKDREMKARAQYVLPPSTLDVRTASVDEIDGVLAQSEKDSLVTALAMDLGLGGVYAEEVCARAGVDKKSPAATKVAKFVQELFSQNREPCKDEKRVYPFRMESRETSTVDASFGSALATMIADEVRPEQVRSEHKQKKKMESMLEHQLDRIEKLEIEAQECSRKGELIYEQYQVISEILATKDPEKLKKFKEVKRVTKEGIEVEL